MVGVPQRPAPVRGRQFCRIVLRRDRQVGAPRLGHLKDVGERPEEGGWDILAVEVAAGKAHD